MIPPILGIADLPGRFRRGETVYLQGACGEPRAFRDACARDPKPLAGVTLTGCFIPGMNDFDYAALHPEAGVRTFMAAPHRAATIADGRTQLLPLTYAQIAAHLTSLKPDLAILMVAPPDDGFVSMGSCADFGPLVAQGAMRLIGVINTALPRPVRAPRLRVEAFEAFIEVHEPLDAPAAAVTDDLAAIGRRVAALVPDRAAIETGVGAAPTAVWGALDGHRGLTLQSGMITDGFVDALEAGAMAESGHLAGVAYGGARLAATLDVSERVTFADVSVTHNLARLASLPRFTAINSALEVDLFGQANLEWLNGRMISGVGGASDFSRAAQMSRGGRSILALSSTAKGGAISRIRPRLTCPASLSRTEVDTVVTEFGVAELRGKSIDQRADALIAIAAPDHRDALANDWKGGR